MGSLVSFGPSDTSGIPDGYVISSAILVLEAVEPDTGAVRRVENLTNPVLLSTPLRPATFAVNDTAACIYRSPRANIVSWQRDGCLALPNPRPPGVSLRWKPGFTLTGESVLADAWLVDNQDAMSGCASQATKLQSASDPYYSYNGYRYFTGESCKLVDKNNEYGCYWDNSAQAFKGTKCTKDGDQEAKCTHFTEFATRVGPAVLVTYPGQLELEADGSLTNYVVIVACLVFIVGLVAACVAFYWNYLKRRNLMSRLQAADCGYQLVNGTWTWAWHVDLSEPGTPRGPGPALAAAIGLPWRRLFTALPEKGSLGLGERQSWADTSDAVQGTATWHERALGTAMVHAWLSLTGAVPIAELLRQGDMANRLFAGVLPMGFAALVARFRAMLSPGAHSLLSSGWLIRAHSWRLVFSQSRGGLWGTREQAAAAAQALGAIPLPPFNDGAGNQLSDDMNEKVWPPTTE